MFASQPNTIRLPKSYLTGQSTQKVRQDFAVIIYVLLCIRGFLGHFDAVTLPLTILVNFCLFCCIDYKRAKPLILIAVVYFVLTVYNFRTLGLADILLFVCLLDDVPLGRLVKANFVVLLGLIVVWFYAYQFGYIHSHVWIMPKGEAVDYGVTNPNILGSIGFQVIAISYLLCKEKFFWIWFCPAIVANQIAFEMSASRTPWISGMVLMFMALMLKLNIVRQWMRYVFAALPFILIVVLFYFISHQGQYPELNLVFTGRLPIYEHILKSMSPLNWLVGIELPLDEPMDGSYIMLLFTGGLPFLGLYLYFSTRAFVKQFQKVLSYLAFMTAIMASGVAENTFASASGLSVIFWKVLYSRNL